MFNIILATLIFLGPFILVCSFQNKLKGFLYIFNGLIIFHLITALLTQFLGVFNYPVVITINILLLLGTITYLFIKKVPIKINSKFFNIFFIIIFAIISFQLWSVHNLYTGTSTTINGYVEVENMKYPYPYFSDEWIAVLFTNHSIETGALPTVNPMNYDAKITNLLVPYFSFVSNFFLIANIDPIENFFILPLLTGILITLFSFILLRVNSVALFPALLTSVLITYISNGVNLPGIWYALPYTIGLIIFLNALIVMSLDKKVFAVLTSALSIIFYPPIFVFVVPTLLYWYYKNSNFKKFVIFGLSTFLFLGIFGFLIFYLGTGHDFYNLIKVIFNAFIFREGVEGGIPKFSIFDVIPFVSLFFAIIGLYQIYKNKKFIILIPIVIGLIYWIFYGFTTKVFLIEYPRIVVITSVLITIIAGFGINFVWEKFVKEKTELYLKISIVIILFALSFFYTQNNNWENFLLVIDKENGVLAKPAAPTNIYLKEKDMDLFKDFENKRFIAHPWKGLVLGATTSNIPMHTKTSTIANNYIDVSIFAKAGCEQKQEIAEKFKMDLFYLNKFDCPGFVEIEKGADGLILYSRIK